MPTITSYFGFLLAALTITSVLFYWSKQNTTYLKLIE
uniref:Cytochrome b6-f complex subunit 6 n=1 Tax=Brassica campestris TaxID=3711 RepID=A0A3P6D066_BRACM|nr:unnamed protein product [Brassica rapa]